MQMKSILVVVEPDSETQPALDKAAQLARHTGAALELMIADYNPFLEDGYYFDPLQAQKMRYEHGEQRMQELEALADPLRSQGLSVSAATAWGNPPHDEIIRRVKETAPDLVMASTRHHNKVARLFLANEDWELVRYCPVPLLLVKARAWPEKPVFVAAVDPDHAHDKPAALDNKIIAVVKALAAVEDGNVHLFHSSWLPPLSGVYPLIADRDSEEDKLGKLAARNDVAEENCHLSDQEIADSLPALVAELKASVVAMGAVSRSRLDRVLIGNTAERLLDHLDCDILVVKPDEMPALKEYLI